MNIPSGFVPKRLSSRARRAFLASESDLPMVVGGDVRCENAVTSSISLSVPFRVHAGQPTEYALLMDSSM